MHHQPWNYIASVGSSTSRTLEKSNCKYSKLQFRSAVHLEQPTCSEQKTCAATVDSDCSELTALNNGELDPCFPLFSLVRNTFTRTLPARQDAAAIVVEETKTTNRTH
eukprot:3335833-Amphidinium_carterae.1